MVLSSALGLSMLDSDVGSHRCAPPGACAGSTVRRKGSGSDVTRNYALT